ncbi:MAG: PepSY domain-containing protein [Porticoccaceae bacterium]|nr:PepSY domain-containing protein [Porticoccaceae bacterium]
MASTTLYRWHRRIGLAVFAAIIAWALSGLSHPIMSRLNPRPVAMQPPQSSAAIAELAPLSVALSGNGITEFRRAQLLNVDEASFYRVQHGAKVSYINARSGQQAVIDDRAYAEKLARHYLGDASSSIASIELITAFNEDYLYVNRFLPVYKVTFARPDNMRAYVELSTGRLATLIDDRKAFVGWVFRQLHSWVFIANPWLRTIAMSVMLLAGMGLSFVGLLMAWRGSSKDTAAENVGEPSQGPGRGSDWHRRLGIGFGVLMLTFCFSGLYHLLSKPIVAPPALSAPLTAFNAEDLNLDWQAVAHASGGESFRRGSLVEVDGEAYLRLILAAPQATAKSKKAIMEHHSSKPMTPRDGPLYINARTSELCADCEHRHVRNLAAHYGGSGYSASAGQLEKITRFSSDYGFINKRMPVYAVRYGGDGVRGVEPHSLFIETATGALAARTSPASKWEGWSFSYLHKWHFFDPISKTLRDILLIVTTLALTVLCLLGVWVSLKPRTRV